MIEKFLITNGNYNAILANPARLRENNITKIYLRDKKLPSEIFRAFLELQSALKNVEIFVNYAKSPTILAHKYIHLKSDELHLAKSLKSQNLGVESTHPLAPSAREGKNKILSYSAHSLKDIICAHKAKINYIFISPIFAVENKNAPLGIEFLKQIPREIKPKIFALGGINADNIKDFENLGIRGVAGSRAFGKIFD